MLLVAGTVAGGICIMIEIFLSVSLEPVNWESANPSVQVKYVVGTKVAEGEIVVPIVVSFGSGYCAYRHCTHGTRRGPPAAPVGSKTRTTRQGGARAHHHPRRR
eukprot:SAG11_NODE_2267_length_3601_cov_2.234723_2_plen_104_part_00